MLTNLDVLKLPKSKQLYIRITTYFFDN